MVFCTLNRDKWRVLGNSVRTCNMRHPTCSRYHNIVHNPIKIFFVNSPPLSVHYLHTLRLKILTRCYISHSSSPPSNISIIKSLWCQKDPCTWYPQLQLIYKMYRNRLILFWAFLQSLFKQTSLNKCDRTDTHITYSRRDQTLQKVKFAANIIKHANILTPEA